MLTLFPFLSGMGMGAVLSVLVAILFRVLRPRVQRVSLTARVRWGKLGRRIALVAAPVVANGLYASLTCAQGTLEHVDPLVFAAVQLSTLLPVAVVILAVMWRTASRESVRLGLLGGIPLGGCFVCIALSMHRLGLLPTAMLTALDGVVASGIARLVFGQRLAVSTGLAMACAVAGAFFLWWVAPSAWQPDLVALACGLLYTAYTFQVQRTASAQEAIRTHLLPFLGGAFVSMALVALALALCFGRWETLGSLTTGDLGIMLYCGLAAVLIPLVISTVLLRTLSAVTLAFLSILEPLISLGVTLASGSLSLPLVGWCGVSLVGVSVLLQAHPGHSRRSHPRWTPDRLEATPAGEGEDDGLACPSPV